MVDLSSVEYFKAFSMICLTYKLKVLEIRLVMKVGSILI